MSEFTDSMLDGLFCQECGVLVDGKAPGYPRKCSDCQRDEGYAYCRYCSRRISENGLEQHQRAKHPKAFRRAQRAEMHEYETNAQEGGWCTHCGRAANDWRHWRRK